MPRTDSILTEEQNKQPMLLHIIKNIDKASPIAQPIIYGATFAIFIGIVLIAKSKGVI